MKTWLTVLLALTLGLTAQAQQADTLREEVNRGTVGIISGGVNGTYIRISADLANVLDDDDLRVLSVIGKGSVQNVKDLLYLRGIDVAIVQSDVLEYLRRQGTYPGLENHIHYITKLYNEEFHLLARSDITTVQELAGRKVNMDNPGSGTSMTASLVFDSLGVAVEPVYHDQATALELLKNAEIAALVYVAGKPAPLFTGLAPDSGLHFLPIDYSPQLLETYLPTQLDHQDYPQLIPGGQAVDTLAVGAVMAVYNWHPDHPRYTKTARFVNRLFGRFEDFQQPPRHPKWREISLSEQIQ